jgi:hypothetical protein
MMRTRETRKYLIGIAAYMGAIWPASSADPTAALQLVQEAFKCPGAVSGTGATKSLSELAYKGDSNKFVLTIDTTTDQEAANTTEYDQLFGTYTSFYSLLAFDQEGAALRITCQKPACLSHTWVSTGCDSHGVCSNVSTNSLQREYINSLRVNLCSADAAKDASDALNLMKGSQQ